MGNIYSKLKYIFKPDIKNKNKMKQQCVIVESVNTIYELKKSDNEYDPPEYMLEPNTNPTPINIQEVKELRPIDIIILQKENPFITNRIVDVLKEKLYISPVFKKFFDNEIQISNFFKLLNENCIISGSTILQYLLDEFYIYNNHIDDFDLDMYMDSKNAYDVIKFLKQCGYYLHEYTKKSIYNGKYFKKCKVIYSFKRALEYDFKTNTFKNIMINVNRSPKEIQQYIKNIYINKSYLENRYCRENKKIIKYKNIQLMVIDESIAKSASELIEEFDFNILKNYYDGTNFHIHDTNAVSKKINTINESVLLENKKRFYRMNKYCSRGIKFHIIPKNDTLSKKTIQNLLNNNKLNFKEVIL